MNLQIDTHRAFQLFQVLRQLAILVIAIALARSDISQSVIGNYEMLFFLLYAVSFFWISGCAQALLTRYPKLSPEDQPKLLFQLFVLSSIASIGIVLLLFWQQAFFLELLIQRTQLDYFALFLLYMLFSLPTYLVEHIYLLQQKRVALISYAILSGLVQITAVLLPLILGYDFKWSFVALIGVGIIKYTWLLYIMVSMARWSTEWRLLRHLLLVALPLILYALLGGAAQIVDAYLVNWKYQGDTQQFAIFRYGARELPFALAIAVAFSSSWLSTLSKATTTHLHQFRARGQQLYHILFPMAIAAAFASSYLFPWILGADFTFSYYIFNIYLLIIPSRLLFPHTLLIAQEENRYILYTSIAELCINVSISLLLIEKYGMLGIAVGTVVAYLFEKIVYAVIIYRRQGIAIQKYTALGWWTGYTIALVGSVVYGLFLK
ncbi:MAG: polysaccharide biosynthesis C-terminal domain-containing protein [Bacteroidota bacterium]